MARRSANRIDATMFKHVIRWVVRDLGLQNEIIKYQFKPYLTIGGRCVPKESDLYIIQVSTLESISFILHTIAHELRHVYQYKHQMIKEQYDSEKGWLRTWNDDPKTYLQTDIDLLFNTATPKYCALPWEKDAINYAASVFPTLQKLPLDK